MCKSNTDWCSNFGEDAMKDFLAVALFSALALFACSSETRESGMSGRYVGTQNFGIAQITSPIVIQIRQSGLSLTGTVTPPFQEDMMVIFNGRLDGTLFTFD